MTTTVTASQIQALYVAYFNRPADPIGLQFWLDKANAAGGVAAVANGFSGSPEYTAQYPAGTSYTTIVNQIYQNLFGRPAEPAGLVYWANQLAAGTIDVGHVAYIISQSAQGPDLIAVNDKVAAATAFTASLNTTAAITSYDGSQAAAVASTWLSQVVDDSSLNAAISAPALAAVAAAVVAAHSGQSAVTTNLTTGVDNITGAAGNVAVNAVFGTIGAGNPGDTLNSLDSIHLGGTGNVLNIVDQGGNGTGGVVPTISVSGVQTANIKAVGGETVDTSGWTGLTALNLTASKGVDVVTAAGTTAVAVTDTLASAAAAAAALNTTIDGGSTVTLTATGATTTAHVVIGDIVIGGNSAPTGAVTVSAVETLSDMSLTDVAGNIIVDGGTAVTINSTVNVSDSANTGAVVTGATITVDGAAGAVVVNNTLNVADTKADVITGDAVNVTGGTTVVINNVVTSTAGATASAAATAIEGAVTVLDGGTATSVTVNQTVATAVEATPAVTVATPPTVTAGGIGYDAVTTVPGTPVSAAVPGVIGVTAGTVAIAGAADGQLLADASNTVVSASLNGFGAGSFINSNVLTSLTLAGEGVDLTVDNAGTTLVTTLALNTNGYTGTSLTEAGVKTLNVTTGGTAGSNVGVLDFADLVTLNVAGTQTLKANLSLDTLNLKSIVVSGAAGFNDGGTFADTAPGATLTTTSSGKITATLHLAGTDTFTGSTGTDVITITADQTKAVVAGSGTADELVLAGDAATFLGGALKTAAHVSGFEVLGINNDDADGIYDLSLLATGNNFNAIDVKSTDFTAATFTNVAKNTSLTFATGTDTGSFVYQSIDAQDATGDTVAVNLGTAAHGATILTSLTMEDTNLVGITTLNVVANDIAANAGAQNEIINLIDSGLATLNVSGVDGLLIDTLDQGIVAAGGTASASKSFTINNTSGGVAEIGTFTDSALGTLTFNGTGDSQIDTLVMSGHSLTIANSGTGAATIGTLTAVGLNSLTLTGQVAVGTDTGVAGVANSAADPIGLSTGVTVAAAGDNAHINLTLTGAASGSTDNITVGNGNDYITDSGVGTVNITVGTGSNLIDVSAGLMTDAGVYNITLGAHTVSTTGVGADQIAVSVIGATAAGHINTVITGAVAGDHLVFADAVASPTGLALATTAQQTAITAAATLTAAVNLAFGDAIVQHGVFAFQYGGNTFVIEQTGAATAGVGAAAVAADSIVELIGVHSASTVIVGHTITLA